MRYNSLIVKKIRFSEDLLAMSKKKTRIAVKPLTLHQII